MWTNSVWGYYLNTAVRNAKDSKKLKVQKCCNKKYHLRFIKIGTNKKDKGLTLDYPIPKSKYLILG